LRIRLLELRERILRSSRDLAEEALKGSGQDFSVDHMADHGSDNFEQEVSLSLLEGEQETLDAVETAIRRLDGSEEPPYGICLECAEADGWPADSTAPWIPTPRLEFLPYATLCVAHQEEQEEVEA
jgi:DnaK suppressor protein